MIEFNEPWEYDAEASFVWDANGVRVLNEKSVDFSEQEPREVLRRIVACVNACRGIPTEILENQERLKRLNNIPVASEAYCAEMLRSLGYVIKDPHE